MASVITTSVDKARVKSILPDWFKPETGFRFLYGKDEAVVVGFGAYRHMDIGGSVVVAPVGKPTETYYINSIEMRKPTLVISYLYKGEWYLNDIERILHNAEADGGNVNDVIFPIDHKFGDDRDER
jgi:hypothetical protein